MLSLAGARATRVLARLATLYAAGSAPQRLATAPPAIFPHIRLCARAPSAPRFFFRARWRRRLLGFVVPRCRCVWVGIYTRQRGGTARMGAELATGVHAYVGSPPAQLHCVF
ncbi:hypothetical protein GGS23DRAFT_585635 [Durotheca rogersii]|uniref:uncharacterized protein n=1 Tax=Durotheca rogersii TaxID=419775 RepID=UPI00222027B6|nr:uncharacterized protein GGS23DRAFT_585635 [Durotheca rogersii]KAI5859487.1 hypothetical protein GGS23DRAFT_585635 [Durotheca rogersii]